MRRVYRQTIAVIGIAALRMRIRLDHEVSIGVGMGMEVGMTHMPNAREHEQAEQKHSKGTATADTEHKRIMARVNAPSQVARLGQMGMTIHPNPYRIAALFQSSSNMNASTVHIGDAANASIATVPRCAPTFGNSTPVSAT